MPTITALDFARLDEARRLQVERYRTAYFKREGELPKDDDPAIDREYLRVKLGDLDKCIPVGTLTKWGKTFGEAAPLSFELNGMLTVKRGRSSLRLFVQGVEHDDKGNAYRGKLSGYANQTSAPLDAPVVLTVKPDNTLTLDIPDLASELKALRAETTANRKQVAKDKVIEKAAKEERKALDKLTRATTEANEQQAILDSMTVKQAVKLAKRCLEARRLYRATLTNPESVPAWFLPAFESERWDNETQTSVPESVDTLAAWREYLTDYQAANAALQAYEPRKSWPSYVASLASEAGLSLAAYKKANPDRAFKTYGPQFDKLKEAKRKALDSLGYFIGDRFKEYLAAQGLPDCLGCKWSFMNCRAYSRARLHLVTWKQRKADLESQHREAVSARERAEA